MQASTSFPVEPDKPALARPVANAIDAPSQSLKPLRWPLSILLVLIPSLIGTLTIQVFIPRLLQDKPVPFLYLYLPWWIVFSGLSTSIAALVAYRLEGNRFNWQEIRNRYRLHRIRGAEWRWFMALLVTFTGAILLLQILGPTLASIPGLGMPAAFPVELDPSKNQGLIPGKFMGAQLAGNWWIALVYFIGWILNILGEELWFRGYMLPRQEAAYGRKAWILHGIVWGLHHLWQRWTLIILAPYALLWSYIIQRGKNTTIPIVVHGAGNLIPLIFIIGGVLSG